MKRVVFNSKGGVGKTSITCNLAAAAASLGRRVLVLDLDAQANTTHYLLGTVGDEKRETMSDFFASTLGFTVLAPSLKPIIVATRFPNLSLAPADSGLADLQTKLESRYKVMKLKHALNAVLDEFDEVFIDTPPALNFYTMSAMLAADRLLVPFDCDSFSADALDRLQLSVQEVQEDHNPDLVLEGIVVNNFQTTARWPRETIAALRAKDYPVLEPFLRASVVMKESHAAAEPLPFFRPGHKLAQEFQELAEKLVLPRKEKTTTRKKTRNAEATL